jgi:Inosine-uridine preferring nucleoside hydrolase
MQFQPQGKPSPGIVFDADLGNTIDDALALAMLFGFQGKNESRVLSVSTTKSSLDAAIFADVLVRFYTGEPGPFAPAIPIGLSLSGKMAEPNPMLAAVTGNAKYARTIVKMNDTADPLALIRNALSAQFDQNAVVVLTGPATNLAGLLAIAGTAQLIAQKVHMLVVAADALTLSDVPAAKHVFAEWPTAIMVAGSELGDALPFPCASIDKDFAWSEAHPLVAAYRAYRPMPYDAPAVAMAAALYAVRPQENYFKLSDPGTVSVADDGSIRLTPVPAGKHRTLIADATQKERIQQIYAETASTKPVGRIQRFRPPPKKQ